MVTPLLYCVTDKGGILGDRRSQADRAVAEKPDEGLDIGAESDTILESIKIC
ncbi:MAG: hypothetical protein VKJ27_06995 [Synechocystis sp.]|nr:hypothetical protein [Synechocystis sp.]